MRLAGYDLCVRRCARVKLVSLAARYMAFAMVAISANLGMQRLVLRFGETMPYFVAAVGAGTMVGLIVKYVLDKRWIFQDGQTGMAYHRHKFFLYMVTGVLTTGIFWGLEFVFWVYWGTSAMRELGAVLGLSIGYVVKYYLDRRFVFGPSRVAM